MTTPQRIALLLFCVGEHIVLTDLSFGHGAPTFAAVVGTTMATIGAVFFVYEREKGEVRS